MRWRWGEIGANEVLHGLHRRVWLGLELEVLESFRAASVAEVEVAANIAEQGVRSRESWDTDDLANELMLPFGRLELAVRTVFYELVSILEQELQRVAWAPWIEKRRATRPKLAEGKLFDETQKWFRKEITDLPYRQLEELIETYYQVGIQSLSKSGSVQEIRRVANDLKHRRGRVDRRPQALNLANPLEKHKLSADKAGRAILDTQAFLEDLWESTGTGFRDQPRPWPRASGGEGQAVSHSGPAAEPRSSCGTRNARR